MPKALALQIGLNSVNPASYSGWSGPLAGCENDANDMANIAKKYAMTTTTLLTAKATRAAVLANLSNAAKTLQAGDLFFLTYSGHGGQMPDINGDETDKQDETWCLYDGELIDDELYAAISAFKDGVRLLVLSDSCHSGTVTRERPKEADPALVHAKLMPPDIAAKVYADHKDFYDQLQKDVAGVQGRETAQAGVNGWNATLINFGSAGKRLGQWRMNRAKRWVETNEAGLVKFNFDEVQRDEWSVYMVDRSRGVNIQLDLWRRKVIYSDAKRPRFDLYDIQTGPSVILISGCQDNQLSLDGARNGKFTETLLKTWNNGNFVGNYTQLHKQIVAKMPNTQTPNLFTLGQPVSFLKQAPFSVA
jgi:hypothetical protein